MTSWAPWYSCLFQETNHQQYKMKARQKGFAANPFCVIQYYFLLKKALFEICVENGMLFEYLV